MNKVELSYQDLYEGFTYLDELKEGNSINMYGAGRPLAAHLHIGSTVAHSILSHWMATFDETDVEDRVEKTLESMAE